MPRGLQGFQKRNKLGKKFKKGHSFIRGGEKGWFKKGNIPPTKGVGHSEDTRKKMSIASKGKPKPWLRGENNHNWKGGIQRNRHKGDWRYARWRLAVFTRDSFTCQGCKNVGGYLQAHHIKKWSKYLKLRYMVNNGVTLCLGCHKSLHSSKKRNLE